MSLCVNQGGERVEDRNINVLHVMANESFAEFAEKLQKEIEDDTGIRFGALEAALFAGMVYEERHGEERAVTSEQAEEIVRELESLGIIDEKGLARETVLPDETPLAEQMVLPPVRMVLKKSRSSDL